MQGGQYIAQKILNIVREKLVLAGKELYLSTNVGIANFDPSLASTEMLLAPCGRGAL
jgi:GGDEF domain-containing protein